MKTLKRQTGDKGEDEACSYLESLGHVILERNWTASHLELDVVTLKGGELHFVEVKTRREPITADPVVNVDAAKRKNMARAMARAAAKFLHSPRMKGLPKDLEVLFDVVTVKIGPGSKTEIAYYPQAFIPTYV